MRLLSLLLPALLVVAACSDAEDNAAADSDVGDTTENLTASGCAISRAQILGSVSPARQAAIKRGFTWFDDHVPYSQSKTHEGYRTDCSGFVSMSWELSKPGETTSSFGESSKYPKLSSYNDLVPGDALNAAGHHVVMFLGWNDKAKSGMCVIEQQCTKCGMQFHVRSTSSMKGEYKGMRAPQFVKDTSAKPGGAAEEPVEETPTETATTPKETTPKPPSHSSPPAAPSGSSDSAECGKDGDCNPGNDGSGKICSGGVEDPAGKSGGGTCVPGCRIDAHCPGVTRCKSGTCQ
jgi:hypothetical protein